MNWASLLIVTAFVLSAPIVGAAQASFSGHWTFNQERSGRGTAGNSPQVAFPSTLVIKHSTKTLEMDMSTFRQATIKAVLTLDGAETVLSGSPPGVTIRAKARMEGEKIVVDYQRSFQSPAGEVVNEIQEIYALVGDTLTVEKTENTGAVKNSKTAVYTKGIS